MSFQERATSHSTLTIVFHFTGKTGPEHVLLTPEIMLKIFSFLRTKDICLLSRVCKAWRNIARDHLLFARIDLESCTHCCDVHIIVLLRNIGAKNLSKVLSLNIVGTGISGETLPLITAWCTGIRELKLSSAQVNRMFFPRAIQHLKHLLSLSIRDCGQIDHE